MPVMPWWEVAIRLVLALVLGGVIGYERERRGKPAGLRTHMLVSVAAAVFVLSAQEAARRAGEPVDSVRALTGIAQGVGFLGAGVILQSRGEVRWLTTAAALWAAAAVGLGAAMGMYYIVIVASALVWIILRWLDVVEGRIQRAPDGSSARTNGKRRAP
jgi:putative Mg2+ transporter-C (MgtC) family protein